MTVHPTLSADRDEIGRFVRAMFPHARPGGFLSLRVFDQFNRGVPPCVQGVRIGSSLEPIIEAATRAAQRSADTVAPTMFAPPIATFSKPDKARNVDLAEGLALTVDLDTNPEAGRAALEALLGPPTVAVGSGSFWQDPETCELLPKVHLHWLLREPTRDQAGHERLRQARALAAKLAGGDSTGASIVHPFRWPGSWNRKAAPPTLARIVEMNEGLEINLEDALSRVAEAAGGVPTVGGMKEAGKLSSRPQASLAKMAAALAHIPNKDPEDDTYERWIKMGIAVWRGTDGSAEGLEVWDSWAARSGKYKPGECARKWRSFGA